MLWKRKRPRRFRLINLKPLVAYSYKQGLDSRQIVLKPAERVMMLINCPLKPPFRSRKRWKDWLVINQTTIGMTLVSLEKIMEENPEDFSLTPIEE